MPGMAFKRESIGGRAHDLDNSIQTCRGLQSLVDVSFVNGQRFACPRWNHYPKPHPQQVIREWKLFREIQWPIWAFMICLPF